MTFLWEKDDVMEDGSDEDNSFDGFFNRDNGNPVEDLLETDFTGSDPFLSLTSPGFTVVGMAEDDMD